MRRTIIFILFCHLQQTSVAQSLVSKDSLAAVFAETLKKARMPVSDATNAWRYDDSNGDYFSQDTIVLNTARSYKQDYCNGVSWSFYKECRFELEFTRTCQEPPVKLTPKAVNFMKVRIVQRRDKCLLKLFNHNGLQEIFEVLDLKRNPPLSDGESAFDYTMVLVRLK